MQSEWLIVVSCALRQDHHQLFRPFTWCWTPITMKVTVMPICFYVYTCCGHDQAEEFRSDKIFFSSPYFLGLLVSCIFCIYLYPVKLFSSSEIYLKDYWDKTGLEIRKRNTKHNLQKYLYWFHCRKHRVMLHSSKSP